MLQAATYTDGNIRLHVAVERIDILLKSEEILNFPRIIELARDKLVLPYGRGRHGGKEGRPAAMSEDGGKSWADLPPASPWTDNVQTSGILGYLRNGMIAYIDVFPREAAGWSREQGVYHRTVQLDDPSWRLRHFSRQGELIDTLTMKVKNLPWPRASYENYGTILELANGDLLTAFEAHVPPLEENRFNFTTFVARSADGGKTFEHVHTFSPYRDGKPVGDEGYCEPDLAILANGDILCLLRTGSRSTLEQSRSRDGGLTWSEPVSIGWPGVKPDLCLLSNGVLACSSGRGAYGHPQVSYAMFSLDGTGNTWELPFAFHTGPGCSYTSNMERDGKFYVVYSDSSFTKEVDTYQQPFQSIKWAVLDVQKENL